MAPYDDFSKEVENIHQRMLRWLENMSRHRVSNCFSGKAYWIPSADIHETETAYHIFVDLAGIDPATIDLIIDGSVLRLSGERERSQVQACTRVHQLEMDSGMFRRVFQFPTNLNSEDAESSYRDGILEITLPKRQKPTSIQIPLRQE